MCKCLYFLLSVDGKLFAPVGSTMDIPRLLGTAMDGRSYSELTGGYLKHLAVFQHLK